MRKNNCMAEIVIGPAILLNDLIPEKNITKSANCAFRSSLFFSDYCHLIKLQLLKKPGFATQLLSKSKNSVRTSFLGKKLSEGSSI